jgi:hypothetical protein
MVPVAQPLIFESGQLGIPKLHCDENNHGSYPLMYKHTVSYCVFLSDADICG